MGGIQAWLVLVLSSEKEEETEWRQLHFGSQLCSDAGKDELDQILPAVLLRKHKNLTEGTFSHCIQGMRKYHRTGTNKRMCDGGGHAYSIGMQITSHLGVLRMLSFMRKKLASCYLRCYISSECINFVPWLAPSKVLIKVVISYFEGRLTERWNGNVFNK